MSTYTQNATEIEIANKTSRTNGAVGKNAIVPRLVRAIVPREHIVLDFGAGKDAAHAAKLRSDGFKIVDAYEFGANVDPELHLKAYQVAERGNHYDCVYASNVLNVQSSGDMMQRTLRQVCYFLHHRGQFVCNYPHSPRKSELAAGTVERMLGEYFDVVERWKGSTPTWVCRNKRK